MVGNDGDEFHGTICKNYIKEIQENHLKFKMLRTILIQKTSEH